MRLHELAHRMATDVQMLVASEHRQGLLKFVLGGFSESDEPEPSEVYRDFVQRMAADVRAVPVPSHRLTLLEVVLARFDERGEPQPLETYQQDWMQCIDCPEFNTPKCRKCSEIHAETHAMMDPLE